MPSSDLISTVAASFPQKWETTAVCPSCAARGLHVFYAVADIPVHSCLLMSTREEAVRFPRGDLRLGFCPECGFITNTRFDVAHNAYSTTYEETQGFSPTFSRFAEDLARQLIEAHDLKGKRILEIGCGKGEFLVKMCELGGCSGIGIDPAYRPERTRSEAASRIEFIQDLYDRRYAHLPADCIVCRHTLEHIAPTRRFVHELREIIGDRDVVVFFELPDVMRELREGAFWDLYYEHCSYFSAGSLARLFHDADFRILDLELAYDGQYILLTACPADGRGELINPLAEDLAELRRRVKAFAAVTGARLQKWREYLESNAGKGRRTVLWGSGSKGVSFLTTLRIAEQIEIVVDINPYRQGRFMPGTGHQIVSPEFLQSYRPDSVIVMNPVYIEEIRRDLEELGLFPEVVVV